jgi:hypothetical protein
VSEVTFRRVLLLIATIKLILVVIVLLDNFTVEGLLAFVDSVHDLLETVYEALYGIV